ncbi:HpcH/HpaI aldolase/citrate lyase family protein [Cognatiyoonia sp. IB215182]|uniref:HpcH/HpaI aldolase family protein n=1 Tax=Cognatiyoonia sp. IB215182 TaxID=3097353 RepID=UPI002A0CBD9E|nr:HpcH/HpaI aldolase/citrate lyase family protein [Cognatiyoonia sp. IB215182]MDX8353823.1 HpcH/HpaI aldolase/citrate lyase family protein [Cognatiyoonia sp. IB215182]
MKMPENAFLHALRNGEKQVGLWVSMASNYAAEVTAGAGYDWLVVDMEHSPGSVETTLSQLQAIAPYPGTAIVRTPWNDPVMVKRLLDIGAQGMLFPMVQTAQEAEAAVAATRYPPDGIRGVAGSMRGSRFGRIDDYYAKVNDETAVIVQVETLSALQQAEDISGVKGVDGIFFGPADIAADMGLIGQPMHEEVWAVIVPVARALMARGMPVGTLVTDPDFATTLLTEGFTFVACGTDTGLLRKATDELLAQMRQGIKEE